VFIPSFIAVLDGDVTALNGCDLLDVTQDEPEWATRPLGDFGHLSRIQIDNPPPKTVSTGSRRRLREALPARMVN
jgi:hypothetical protein